jgi:hypothetical protein
MRRALLLACVLILAGCGGDDEDAREPEQSPEATLPAELLQLYGYDISAPFDEQEVKSEQKDARPCTTSPTPARTDASQPSMSCRRETDASRLSCSCQERAEREDWLAERLGVS